MELPDAVFRPLELLLNRGLSRSLTAQAITGELEGRSLQIRTDGMPASLRIEIAGGRAELRAARDSPADATLSGGPLTLLRLMGPEAEAMIRAGDIRVTGDAELAGRFRDLLRLCRPDLEEELSAIVGDPVAHEMGNVVRGLADWGERARQSVGRSIGEYLTEERRTLPTQAEVTEFNVAVDTLANDVERAAARLARLGHGHSPGRSPPGPRTPGDDEATS